MNYINNDDERDLPRHDASQRAVSQLAAAQDAPAFRDTEDLSACDEPERTSHRLPTASDTVTRSTATNYDHTRPDTTDRDPTRSGMAERDQSRNGTTATQLQTLTEEQDGGADVPNDQVEPNLTDNWLDIREAEALLRELGIARTTRTIQRFCQRGELEARLVPTENGSRYIIRQNSIEAFADRFHEILPAGGFTPKTEEHVSGSTNEPTNVRSTNSRSGTHMDQILTLKDEQISLLSSQLDTANKQIAIKDEQIGAMIERDHETNVLIQNLQQLVALPEARARTQEQPNPVDLSNIDSPI